MDVKEGIAVACHFRRTRKAGRQAVSNHASDSAALLLQAAIGASYSERTVAERQAKSCSSSPRGHRLNAKAESPSVQPTKDNHTGYEDITLINQSLV